MKRALISIVILSLGIGSLIAQPKEVVVNKDGKEIRMEIQGDMADLPGGTKVIMKMNKDIKLDSEDAGAADAPYFGIFVEDLTFPKAQELGYKGNYGVLITGVVSGSPAWEYRLQEDDIMLSIDDNEITNNAAFDKIRKTYRAGDAVKLGIFRAGKELTIDFVFGSREKKTTTEPGEKPSKAKKSVGYGGGSWVPMWFDTDMDDINHVITDMGFGKLNEDGVLMQGVAGKGHVGKGFFIGGMVETYEDSKKIQDIEDPSYNLWMRYENTMGGVTLDKRIAVTKNLTLSGGFMLGGATHTLEVLKSNSHYDWADWDNTVLDSQNTHSIATRHYYVVQPKAEIMYHILPWLGFRAEGGYTYGYAPKDGWRVKGLDNESFEVLNSPNTEYQGYTISVGPWFGF